MNQEERDYLQTRIKHLEKLLGRCYRILKDEYQTTLFTATEE